MAVKFMDHTPLCVSNLCKEYEKQKNEKLSRIEIIQRLLSRKETFHHSNLCCSEDDFIERGRPFFNVYPKVIDALSKTSLSVSPSQIPESVIHSLETICVKVPIGSLLDSRYEIGWFFISICNGIPENHPNARHICLSMDYEKTQRILQVSYTTKHFAEGKFGEGYVNSWGTMWNDNFESSDKGFEIINGETEQRAEARRIIGRLACGVMMLAADPDYIKPVLLKADEDKTTPIEERIARAKNRGVYGFTIGEEIERSPHFRRPHFAIRWTGKGAQVAKLVPVKGAVVGDKKLLTSVPTGYENDTEIES